MERMLGHFCPESSAELLVNLSLMWIQTVQTDDRFVYASLIQCQLIQRSLSLVSELCILDSG